MRIIEEVHSTRGERLAVIVRGIGDAFVILAILLEAPPHRRFELERFQFAALEMLALNKVSEPRKGAAIKRNILTAAVGAFFVPIGR